jgi:hypothetical protein
MKREDRDRARWKELMNSLQSLLNVSFSSLYHLLTTRPIPKFR